MSGMIMDYCTKLKSSQTDFLKNDELPFPPHSLDLNPIMSEECFEPRIETKPLKMQGALKVRGCPAWFKQSVINNVILTLWLISAKFKLGLNTE